MARPRLEETNPQLALDVVKLALALGVKPAARASGLSKTTIHAMLRRNDLVWAVRAGQFNRKLERLINGWAGVGKQAEGETIP